MDIGEFVRKFREIPKLPERPIPVILPEKQPEKPIPVVLPTKQPEKVPAFPEEK